MIEKVMTLYQPHATLMVIGAKKIETRPRKWSHLGRVLIHTGLYKGWLHLCEQEPFRSVLRKAGITSADQLPLGAIIGEVIKTGCVPTAGLTLTKQERAFGNYAPGRFAYPTIKPRQYAVPEAMPGQQGFWNLER